MSTIEKEVDSLGRIVLPMKFRKKLGIEINTKVLISLDEERICILPKTKICALCGEKIPEQKNIRLCDSCISMVRSI